jgi:hypothetical protein
MDRFLDTSEDTHFHVSGPRKSIKKRTEKKRKTVPESRLQSRASFRAGEARVVTGNGVTGSEATVGRAYISNSNPTKSLHPPRNFRGDLFLPCFTFFHPRNLCFSYHLDLLHGLSPSLTQRNLGRARLHSNDFFLSENGDHPYEDLAKFGYKLNMKAKKFKNSSIFLATLLIIDICIKFWRFFLNFGRILAIENLNNHFNFITTFLDLYSLAFYFLGENIFALWRQKKIGNFWKKK